MKVSEAIKRLQELVNEYGDLDFGIQDSEYNGRIDTAVEEEDFIFISDRYQKVIVLKYW